KSLVELFRGFGMSITGIDPLKIHGGSMRVFAEKRAPSGSASQVVVAWIEREQRGRLFEEATYTALSAKVGRLRSDLLEMLRTLKSSGKRLAGYGAPAKGNTLLNYFKIGPDLLESLADRNELKHGRYSPGMHIPIVSPDRIVSDPPDYLLVLAWNFADEIISQQDAFRRRGGKFILPIPEVSVIG